MPWVFEHAGKRTEWISNARVAVSSADALVVAATAGLGIVYLAEGIIGRQLAAKQLVPILTDYVRTDPLPVSAIYPHNRHLSAKTRAFVDFAAGLFPRDPGRRVEPAPRRVAGA